MSKSVCSYCFGTGEAQPEDRYNGALAENERSAVLTCLQKIIDMSTATGRDGQVVRDSAYYDAATEAQSVILHDRYRQLTYQGTKLSVCEEAQHRVDTGVIPPFCHSCAEAQLGSMQRSTEQIQEWMERAKNFRLGLMYACKRLELYGYTAQSENAAQIAGTEFTRTPTEDCNHHFSHHCVRCGITSDMDGLMESERQSAISALEKIEYMTEHDSPPNMVASQALSWLNEYQMEIKGWVVTWEPPINKLKVSKFFTNQEAAIKFKDENLHPNYNPEIIKVVT